MIITERDWENLERDHHGSGATVRRIYPRSRHELHIAVRHPDGARMLTLAISTQDFTESLRRIHTLPRTRGIEMDFDRRDARAGTLRVILTDRGLSEVFNPLASDIATVAHTQPTGVEAVLTAVRRFERWRQMLQSLIDSGLSLQSRRGLFGELILLCDHLLAALPAADAVAAWTGPTGTNQDFQLPGAAIEVKTSSGMEPQTLVISNERELDDTGTGHLILAHLSLDERRGGSGESLNAIVDRTRGRIAGSSASEALDGLLVRAGYLRHQRDLYDEPRYTIRKQRFWRVTGEFPRITEADLRPGVGDCEYRISINGLDQYVLAPEDVLSKVLEDSPR